MLLSITIFEKVLNFESDMEVVAIIEQLYRSPDINQAISKMRPIDIQQDLKQEVFIALYEREGKENGFVMRGYSEGWLTWWLVRVMLNKVNDRNFFRDYIFKQLEVHEELIVVDDEPDLELMNQVQETLDAISSRFQKLYWVDKAIFEKYANNENISNLSRETGIPYRTLCRIINNVKTKLKNDTSINCSNSTKHLPSLFCSDLAG